MKKLSGICNGYFYRLIMRIAHKFNWHYAPPIYPEGDTQLWCQWCGFRQTIKRKGGVKIHDAAHKVLHGAGSSKAEKTKRGSALTQRN